MSFLGNSPDYYSLARQGELQRQALIKLGEQQINAIFGGGTVPFYNQANVGGAKFDPKAPYFGFNKKGFGLYAPSKANETSLGMGLLLGPNFSMMTGGGSDIMGLMGGPSSFLGGFGGLFNKTPPSPEEMRRTAFKKGQLYLQHPETFTGFGDDFYRQRAQAYENWALPQEQQQYRSARDQIGFGLANRGLLGGSAARRQASDLNIAQQQARQTIADTGTSQSQALQRQIEDTKNTLLSQLYQSADPARGVSQAISSAGSFAQPSTFAPLTNMFGNLLNQYITGALLNPRQSMPSYATPSYGSNLPFPGNVSVG